MSRKVSDVVAEFLADRGMTHAFGISGAGNLQLLDAVGRRGFTQFVATHHEQAATMATHGYFLARGVPTAAILTTGGGAANGVTGALGAWMDSAPMLVLSGNENSKYTRPDNPLRIYGVQGFDIIGMVRGITKYATRLMDPTAVLYELEKAHYLATHGRPGPVWIDLPLDIQARDVPADLPRFDPAAAEAPANDPDLETAVREVERMLRAAERPVVWLGQGVRFAGAAALVPRLLEAVGGPVLVSWSGIDLVDPGHPLAFGRAGVYGHRCGNFVVQNCDFLLAVGTRLAVPQVGYDITEFARAARVAVVDIDPTELSKYRARYDLPILADAGAFLSALCNRLAPDPIHAPAAWLDRCRGWRAAYPWVDPEHRDADGFLNAYRFVSRLSDYLGPDEMVVTDAGTAALAGHTVLRLRPPQRLCYSFGLGEMGWGLPAAVGASFARNRGQVVCLNCDGSMMLNLQELQTIAHHKLPIKILVLSNDGYLSIKLSQRNLFAGRLTGSDPGSGVSCPRFAGVAAAFGLPAFVVRTWADVADILPRVLAHDGPCICEVFVHPDQPFGPKLGVARGADGALVSPPLEDLSPLLPRDELRRNMLVGVHPKSDQLG